ncbi:hypothetical protein L1D15_21690 [Vibrio sp. Isolate25]|uniref:hypothetical protein n=1 Tax=Vibrio sp. Isolate25 TaxID=2908535 RepID=UPI001EFD792E|nr:hypothetical protein [Vibrio sp. Isolate25]MCG9599307.1 hypothetical protein [Vibrio sp. Isolate25]
MSFSEMPSPMQCKDSSLLVSLEVTNDAWVEAVLRGYYDFLFDVMTWGVILVHYALDDMNEQGQPLHDRYAMARSIFLNAASVYLKAIT